MAVHCGGFVCWPHAIAGIDEELVLETRAKLFQAVAYRGLADAEGFGDLGDASLFIHSHENHKVLHIQFS